MTPASEGSGSGPSDRRISPRSAGTSSPSTRQDAPAASAARSPRTRSGPTRTASIPTRSSSSAPSPLAVFSASPRSTLSARTACPKAALSVLPEAHGAGLGGRLLTEALAWAPSRGIKTLLLKGEADNAALTCLLTRAGAPVSRGPDGVSARLPVPSPTATQTLQQWLTRPAILWHQTACLLLRPI